MTKLGEKMLVVAFSLKGNPTKKKSRKLIKEIMKTIKVQPAHKPVTYDYPVKSKGGTGFTFIQPITESFLAFDSWPDFKGAYLILCSCKLFMVRDVIYLLKKSGYKILDIRINELSLVHDQLTIH